MIIENLTVEETHDGARIVDYANDALVMSLRGPVDRARQILKCARLNWRDGSAPWRWQNIMADQLCLYGVEVQYSALDLSNVPKRLKRKGVAA